MWTLSDVIAIRALLKLFVRFVLQVVGSVLYFTNFCLDKLGQPLLSENPQLTDGWEIPKYPIISVDLHLHSFFIFFAGLFFH